MKIYNHFIIFIIVLIPSIFSFVLWGFMNPVTYWQKLIQLIITPGLWVCIAYLEMQIVDWFDII